MAQHDYIIANQSGAAFRADLNNGLAAIVSQNSGAAQPSTTYAYQWWADTTTGLLKIRNAANNAWITLFQLDGEWTTLAIENGTAAAPSLYFKDSGTDTGLFSPGADQVGIATGGVERVDFGNTEVVFNDGGADVDFRVEGDTNPDLFKIDAGLDQVQVANLNGGPLAGARNRIINGDFDIWQRGTSSFGNGFRADRFNAYLTTGSAFLQERYTLTDAQRNTIGYDAKYAWQGSTDAASSIQIQQSIEGVNSLAGQQVTVSFWAFVNSGTCTISGALSQSFGTGGSPSSQVTTSLVLSATTVTTTPTRITATVALPSISGKTLGSNGDDYLGLLIAKAAGVANTFYITGVQLEPGTVATPFERRSYGQELALCQRYFASLDNGSNNIAGPWGAFYSTTACRVWRQLPVVMRTAPTVVTTGLTFERVGGGTATAASIANVVTQKEIVSFDGIGISATNAYTPASYAGRTDVSAEL